MVAAEKLQGVTPRNETTALQWRESKRASQHASAKTSQGHGLNLRIYVDNMWVMMACGIFFIWWHHIEIMAFSEILFSLYPNIVLLSAVLLYLMVLLVFFKCCLHRFNLPLYHCGPQVSRTSALALFQPQGRWTKFPPAVRTDMAQNDTAPQMHDWTLCSHIPKMSQPCGLFDTLVWVAETNANPKGSPMQFYWSDSL